MTTIIGASQPACFTLLQQANVSLTKVCGYYVVKNSIGCNLLLLRWRVVLLEITMLLMKNHVAKANTLRF